MSSEKQNNGPTDFDTAVNFGLTLTGITLAAIASGEFVGVVSHGIDPVAAAKMLVDGVVFTSATVGTVKAATDLIKQIKS